MRTPGKRRVIRLLRKRWRTKARPRALPPSDPEPIRRKLDSEGLNVSALKSPISTSLCSRRYSLIDSIRSRRRCSGLGKIRNFSRAELGRQRKLGARHQPMGEVVALRVKDDAFRRNGLQLLFQFVHVFRPSDFARIRQTKHEVAKPELLGQYLAQVFQQRGRTLAQKRIARGVRPRAELGAAGLQHYGHVRHQALHHARQFKARLRIELALPGELHVRYHAEQIIAILLHQLGRVFEIRAQQNSRPRLHAHQFVRHVNAFLDHAPRLLDQFGVDHGQER